REAVAQRGGVLLEGAVARRLEEALLREVHGRGGGERQPQLLDRRGDAPAPEPVLQQAQQEPGVARGLAPREVEGRRRRAAERHERERRADQRVVAPLELGLRRLEEVARREEQRRRVGRRVDQLELLVEELGRRDPDQRLLELSQQPLQL